MAFATSKSACGLKQRAGAAAKRGVSCRRMAPAVRRGALQVVAFKDHRDIHREEVILDMGRQVLNGWYEGVKSNGDSFNCEQMAGLLTNDVKYTEGTPVNRQESVGVDALKPAMQAEAQKATIQDWKIVTSGVCPMDDTYFALVEYKYTPKGSQQSSIGYKLISMDVTYDDSVRQISSVTIKRALSPEDVSNLVDHDTAQRLRPSFPIEALQPYPRYLQPEDVLKNVHNWAKARSSGQSEELLESVLAPGARLHDPMMLLHALNKGQQESAPVVEGDAIKSVMRAVKEKYDFEYHVLDCGVSLEHNSAFSHWMAHVTPKGGAGEKFDFEGMEVNLFGEDGKLKEMWIIREPLDTERAILERQGN